MFNTIIDMVHFNKHYETNSANDFVQSYPNNFLI